jgi:membrane protein implicated in regulation of membrane protease activity
VLFYIDIDLVGGGTQVFSVVGLVSFSLGGLLLFGDFALPGFTQEPIDAPNFRVNPWLVFSSTAGVGVVVLLITRSILGARVSGTTRPTAILSLEGEEGVVIVDLVPTGVVKVAGEEWTAVSDSEEHISKGDSVIVSELDGITLKVFKSPLKDE